jgi:Icc-related predicted phosphoesterase
MSDGRDLRIAAIGDVHFDNAHPGLLRDIFADIHRSADVLAICGDLTTHGKVEQMEGFVGELAGVQIPIVAVLGNHDYESGEEEECTKLLCDAGVQVLDGTNTIIEGVGFAGTKGFAGGFGRGALGPFGEPLIKEFVNAAVDEALKLERALQQLRAETRVVLLHYAPLVDTIIGEPEYIYPFLGSSRLLQPIDTLGAVAVFHGHAHRGTLEATPRQACRSVSSPSTRPTAGATARRRTSARRPSDSRSRAGSHHSQGGAERAEEH